MSAYRPEAGIRRERPPLPSLTPSGHPTSGSCRGFNCGPIGRRRKKLDADPHSPRDPARLFRPLVGFALCAIVLLALWFYVPTFFKLNNIINILVQSSILAVIATGMAAVMH